MKGGEAAAKFGLIWGGVTKIDMQTVAHVCMLPSLKKETGEGVEKPKKEEKNKRHICHWKWSMKEKEKKSESQK